jgi:thioredoxin-related protein
MSAAVYWRDSFESAQKEASKEKRPLVLELYLEGCPHCLRLAKETHTDQAVAAALNTRFIPVRLEGRSHMDLVRKFNVPGAPTTIVFSPDGQELHRFAGFLPPDQYLQELEKFG